MWECRSHTVTLVNGHCLRWAYMRTVIEVQAPRLASSNAYGSGPESTPIGVGSSAASTWLPATIRWPYGRAPLH